MGDLKRALAVCINFPLPSGIAAAGEPVPSEQALLGRFGERWRRLFPLSWPSLRLMVPFYLQLNLHCAWWLLSSSQISRHQVRLQLWLCSAASIFGLMAAAIFQLTLFIAAVLSSGVPNWGLFYSEVSQYWVMQKSRYFLTICSYFLAIFGIFWLTMAIFWLWSG